MPCRNQRNDMMKLMRMLLAAALAAVSLQATILINGDFEQPAFEASRTPIYAGDQTLPGWDLWEGELSIYGNGSPVIYGQSLVFDPTIPSEIEQVFPTEPGRTYTLSLWLACIDPTEEFTLRYEIWGLETYVEGSWTTLAEPNQPQQFAVNFTAVSTLGGVLLKQCDGDPGGAGMVDCVGIMVPEPGAWTAMGAISLLGFAIYRRRA